MAQAYVASIEEELICCVCLELFVDPHTPKDLDCPHVTCEVCLNRIKDDSGIIDCPQCRVITRLSKDGVAALRTNLTIRNLAEKHQKHVGTPKQQRQPTGPDSPVPLCPGHENEEVDVVCRGRMRVVEAKINELERDAAHCAKKYHELGQTEEKILSCIQREEEKIDGAVGLAVAKAYEQGDVAKAQLSDAHDKKLKECQRLKNLLQKQEHDLQQLVADTKRISNETSSSDVMTQYLAIVDKLGDTPTIHEGSVYYTPGEVEYVTEPMTLKLGTIVRMGEDVTRKDAGGQVNCSEQGATIRTPTGVRNIDLCSVSSHSKTVISLASNGSGSIYAFTDSKQVHIYRKCSNGQFTKQHTLDMTKFGYGKCYVTIGNDGKILVVKGRCLYVYSKLYKHETTHHTSETYDNSVKLCCIATAPDDKIIVADKGRYVLTVHTPNGKLLQTSNVWQDFKPRYITAVNNTHIAISDQSNKVIVIGRQSWQVTLTLNLLGPTSLYYDRGTCCLLVTTNTFDHNSLRQFSLATGRLVKYLSDDLKIMPMASTLLGDNMFAIGGRKGIAIYKTTVSSLNTGLV